MKNISIIGAGSHTRSSINLLTQYYSGTHMKIYDDSFTFNNLEKIHDIELSGTVNEIDKDSRVFLSIGNNDQRKSFFEKFKNIIIVENLKHSESIIEKKVKLGSSNQIYANVYINSYVEIGDNNIINTSSIIEHETIIGSHNHISIGAKICGRVKIGSCCTIGAASIVIDKISICDNVIVGAGAVVVKDIVEAGTYIGNPARKIK